MGIKQVEYLYKYSTASHAEEAAAAISEMIKEQLPKFTGYATIEVVIRSNYG